MRSRALHLIGFSSRHLERKDKDSLMAIFSRRILQSLINENDNFLPRRQISKLVDGLNRMHKELTLAYEWEVVLIYAFSKVGNVLYEKNFGGKKNADLYFNIIDDPHHSFVADITTVSEEGLDKNNPYEALSHELYNIVRYRGLRPNSFHLEVGSHGATFKGGPKVKLKLPGRSRFSKIIFGDSFNNFISIVIQNPQLSHSYPINTDDADVLIEYNPNQKFASGNHPSYTGLYSLTENHIYQALSGKVSQLIGTKFNGSLGIFLCDGGCNFFNQKPPTWYSYSIDEVVQGFLAHNEQINFVATFTIEPRKKYKTILEPEDYLPVFHLYRGKEFNNLGFDLEGTLKKVCEAIPKPQRNPRNGLYLLKGRNPNLGRSYWGRMELSHGINSTKVKISARAILELLAGKVKQEEFFERHEYIASEENPFNSALDRGQLIKKIAIEKSDFDDDDDWVAFELEGPDPAISPFVVPVSDTKSKKR